METTIKTTWIDLAIRNSLKSNLYPNEMHLEIMYNFTTSFTTMAMKFNRFANKKMDKNNENDRKNIIKQWAYLQKIAISKEEKSCAKRATLLLVDILGLLSDRASSNTVKTLIKMTYNIAA